MATAGRASGCLPRSRGSGSSAAWELDSLGYTVVPPDRLAPAGFTDRLLGGVLACSEKLNGVRPDMATGSTHRDAAITNVGRGEILTDVFFADRIFEAALMNPAMLALVTYLLTDYDEPSGPTLFEPGSHRKCRNPTAEESIDLSAAVPLIAPAGSLLVWHGNTWHGALPRTAPGLRISLLCFFTRSYIRLPKESFTDRVTRDMVDRNPPRFARLAGLAELDRYTECLARHSPFV